MVKENPPTPRTLLRGWFHAGYAPIATAACIVLICFAPSWQTQAASSIYLACSFILFSVSAVYNVFNWKPKTKNILRRIDHADIFLLIAGTYTPLAVTTIPWSNPESWFFSGQTMLIGIWILAGLGLILHVIWIGAPRIVYVVVYICLGIGALIYIPAMLAHGSPNIAIVITMLAVGGAIYIFGAILYAIKWPGKNSKIFGFHELFHICTLLAWASHCISIFFAVLS